MSNNKKKYQLNPILRVLLAGVYDKGSPISSLTGCIHIIQQVWKELTDYWKRHITEGNTFELGTWYQEHKMRIEFKFPQPQGIKINMMPFKMSKKFDDCMLPETVRPYWKFIENISWDQTSLKDKICYITIDESFVIKGKSQRRPGIHTETPGTITINGGDDKDIDLESGNGESEGKLRKFYRPVHWGGPSEKIIHERKGGIYMASSLDKSCEIWDSKILRDEKIGQEIIGEHGDIEHLREFLPESFLTEKNRIYWITDRTPHESLPMKEGKKRQFFRLVTDQVSVWFKDHSTANPNGVMPDPEITTIVTGSKFKGGLKIVDPHVFATTVYEKENQKQWKF